MTERAAYDALCEKWRTEIIIALGAIYSLDLSQLKRIVRRGNGEINGQSSYKEEVLLHVACRIVFHDGIAFLLSVPTTDVNFFGPPPKFPMFAPFLTLQSPVEAMRFSPENDRGSTIDLFLNHRDAVIVDVDTSPNAGALQMALMNEYELHTLAKYLRLGTKLRIDVDLLDSLGIDMDSVYFCYHRFSMMAIRGSKHLKRKLPVDAWREVLRMLD